jgi:hypothetical protein
VFLRQARGERHRGCRQFREERYQKQAREQVRERHWLMQQLGHLLPDHRRRHILTTAHPCHHLQALLLQAKSEHQAETEPE